MRGIAPNELWLTVVLLAVTMLSLAMPVTSLAEDTSLPPRTIKMAAKREHAVMTMDCEGKPPFKTMHCRFYTATIARDMPTKKEKEELEKSVSDMSVSELRRSDLCSKVSLMRESLSSKMANQPLGRRKLTEASISALEDMCRCSTDGCVKAAYRSFATVDVDKKCRLTTFVSHPIAFKRTAYNIWIAQQTSRSCDVSTVMVLERDPELSFEWKLTQTRTGSPDRSSPWCAWQQLNMPQVYSTKLDASALLECKSISFD